MAVVSFGWENGGILADGDVIEPGVGVGLVQPVDVEVAAGFVEIVADFAGASAEAAVDPHFAGGDVVDAVRNVSHGDIGSGEEVAFSPFFGFANVEDEGWGGAVIETCFELLEGIDGEGHCRLISVGWSAAREVARTRRATTSLLKYSDYP